MYRQRLKLSDFTTDLGTIAKNIDSAFVKQKYQKESQEFTIQKRLENIK
jgi:hypothetical protein